MFFLHSHAGEQGCEQREYEGLDECDDEFQKSHEQIEDK